MNVLVLVGSPRPDSLNGLLAKAAVGSLPKGTVVEQLGDLHELPFYTEEADLDPPASIRALRDAVARADALVVTTPEYNASVPAVLKNAIDWASRPRGAASIAGKPAAVLGATPSPGGAASAREHLVAILTRAGARPLETTVGIAGAHAAFADGELVEIAHRDAVHDLVDTLVGELATV